MPGVRWWFVLVVGACMAFAGASPGSHAVASEGPAPKVREQVIELMVAGPDGPVFGRITMYAVEEPGIDMARRLSEGRTAMLARFAGAIELQPGGVTAQFRLFGVRWPQPSANWLYNPAGSTGAMDAKSAQENIALGADGWTNAGGSGFHFDFAGETSTATGCNGDTSVYAKDGKNVVGWGHIVGGYLGYSCYWRGASLVTATPYFEMEEFDIVFEPNFAYSASSLRALALHEFGHSLGLDHTEAGLCPGRAMCAGNDALTFTSPRTDDINGVIALYGVATPTVPSGPRPFRVTGPQIAKD